jgi:predicted nucleotidyltransferase component of viral defense system
VEKVYLEQARLLLRLLPLIDRHQDLALKGGTAINFFVRDLPRLSVDIDLTYLPVTSRESALSAVGTMLDDLATDANRLLPGLKISVMKSPEDGNARMLILRLGGVSVKIEPSIVLRGSVFEVERRTLTTGARSIFELSLEVQILSFADLYGGKICAALDRQYPRDLFDVKLLLDVEGFTEDVRKAFIVYLISHGRPMADLLDPRFQDLAEMFNKEFAGMSFVDISIEDLIKSRKRLVNKIRAELTDSERRFIFSVKEGNPDWQLLGISGIEGLPAVRWKLFNISRMAPQKHKKALDKLRICLEI